RWWGRRARGGAARLGENGVIGELGARAVDDEGFRLPVHLGDEVAGAALVADLAERAEAIEEEGAGATGGVHRDLEKRLGHVATSVAHASVDSARLDSARLDSG